MTFEATVVTLILLLGLWLLYRLTIAEMRVEAEQDSANAPNAHTSIKTAQSGYNGSRWIKRIPKIFTQPHIIPDSISKNLEYRYKTGSARANTEIGSAVAVSTQTSKVEIERDNVDSVAASVSDGSEPVEQAKSLEEPLRSTQPQDTQAQHGIHKLPREVKESDSAGVLTYLDATSVTQDSSTESNVQTQQMHSGQVTQMFVRPDEQDNLKLIKGIGKVMEKTLHDLGITTFKQLASFQLSDIQRVSDALTEFPGRIERDNWVGQARDFHQAKGS